MKNSNRWNRLAQQFVPNSPLIFNLPIGGKILKGWLVLTGSIVLNTTAAGTVMGEGGPTRLFNRIYVRGNPLAGSGYPGGELVDSDPGSLLRFAIAERGRYLAEQSGSTLGNGASGTYQIYLAIPIYWADPNNRRQVETALNSDAYASIQVEADCADITNCFTGYTGAVTYTGLQVQWVDDRENMAGDTLAVYQESHDVYIGAANDRMLDNAMPQDFGFLSWDIFALESAQETLSDAILEQVNLNGDAIDYQKYAQDIRQQMFDDDFCSVGQSATGIYHIDFTDGLVGGNISAATLQKYFKVLNPSGANLDKLRMFTRRIATPASFTPQTGVGVGKNG